MTFVLEHLQPNNIFKYFEIISSIPRGSGNEKAISDYIIKFAEDLGLWAVQDETNNVYIKKTASPGYENAPIVILQGHMDMVCEKNKATSHDFEKSGLNLLVEDDYISAEGTTLGADNGVAIAYQMAVLADNTLKHPALEILMTTDEERGMTGASHIHPEYLDGKILINLDTDLEGEFLVSCAGGVKAYIDLKLDAELLSSSQVPYRILVSGLSGGHSGADIHLERANAHIVMGRILHNIRKHINFYISDIIGGTKDNVIARECECTIVLESSDEALLEKKLKELNELFQHEYRIQDNHINIALYKDDAISKRFTYECTERIIDLLLLIPNGIISFDQSVKGLVETSLNLGIIQVQRDYIRFGSALRSSVPSKKQALVDQLQVICKKFNGEFTARGDYPSWEYCQSSRLRELCISVYKEMYNKAPKMQAIHAGLECGFISEKLMGLDMIAFGPNVLDIHSPNERVSISSMARVYEYLIKLLEKIDTY